eukprot:gene990-9896_t
MPKKKEKKKTDFDILDEVLSDTKKRKLELDDEHEEVKYKKIKQDVSTNNNATNNNNTNKSNEKDEKDKRTIFLLNVPTEYTNEKLKKKFEKIGIVEDVRRLDDKVWVQFAEKKSMEEVLEKKKEMFKQSNIEIKRAKSEIDENFSIFISNLSFQTNENDLTEIFEKCGNINQIKIPVFPDSGKSRGIAYVVFEDLESVENALNLNVKHIGGRRVKVVKSDRSEKSKPSKGDYAHVIWIGNLSNFTSNQTIKDFFADCGMVLDIRRPVFEDSQKPKNHAFVDLDSKKAVLAAVKLNGFELDGRRIRIDHGSRK